MARPRSLTIAIAVFATLFLVVMGYAAALLWAMKDPLLTAIAAFAGLVCLGATAATWWIARALDEADDEPEIEAPTQPAAIVSTPTRIAPPSQAADLPPAYLAAVMKGAQANRAALKARSTQA